MIVVCLWLLLFFAQMDPRLADMARATAAKDQARAEMRNQQYQLQQLDEKYRAFAVAYQAAGEAMDTFASKYNARQGQSWPLAEARKLDQKIRNMQKAYDALIRCEAWIPKPFKE